MAKSSRPGSSKKKSRSPRIAHQFLIVLCETDPLVWRRIQVPGDYTLWDLHVAIQDSMGWYDCHLHEFRIVDPGNARIATFGIPNDDFDDVIPCVPDRHADVSAVFQQDGFPALYVYDFGDNWRHVLMYEGVQPRRPRTKYPICLSGERACPPEDCGGPYGYSAFLDAIQNPEHPEHEEFLDWIGGEFDPAHFLRSEVVFHDPERRWTMASEFLELF